MTALLAPVCLVAFLGESTSLEKYALIGACSVAIASTVIGSIAADKRRQIIGLAMHFLTTVVVVRLVTIQGHFAEILFLMAVQLHFALRLPIVWATVGHLGAVVGIAVLPMGAASTLERLDVVAVGVVIASLAEITVAYRERLVRSSQRVTMQASSLESLAAANQAFVAYLEDAEEEAAHRERLLITRELHDSIGYAMTNISMMMNAAPSLRRDDLDALMEYCRKTKGLASNTLEETRRILYRLRNHESHGPPSAPQFFSSLCRDFEFATNVQTECHLGNLPDRMAPAAFNTLFRAVQVGFINALRHGHTNRINLSFWATDAELRMQIWNDAPDSNVFSPLSSEGIGLHGIRERVDGLNGELTYGVLADGFQLGVAIPIEEVVGERH